jgi:hypothetical protein
MELSVGVAYRRAVQDLAQILGRWAMCLALVAGGAVLGAMGLGVAAAELFKNDERPEVSKGFDHGVRVGFFLGGVAGYFAYARWLRAEAGPVERKDMSAQEANARFARQVTVRKVATLVAFASAVWSSGRPIGEVLVSMPLCAIAMIVYLRAVRCPVCARSMDAAALRERRCRACETAFSDVG